MTQPHTLPFPLDLDGKPRRVGVEIEFAELGLPRISAIIVEQFGGRTQYENDCEMRVVGTRLGDFNVEVDSEPLKTLAKKRRRGRVLGLMERVKGALLGSIAGTLTPYEITTAPLLIEQLTELDRLCQALRRAGARGTEDSILNVFGVHFNPSTPTRDPLVLRDFIRAAALLHDELVERGHMDISRRAVGYAKPYPTSYLRVLLADDYEPDLPQLIDDYMAHNSRNRAVDMLPLFAYLDRERVQAGVSDTRVKARPTFHYRLPNSRVSDPSWSLSAEWQQWLLLEQLAADRSRQREMMAHAREQLDHILPTRDAANQGGTELEARG